MNHESYYPGFQYAAQQLSAYICALNTYLIALKTGALVRFSAPDTDAFRNWLNYNKVRVVPLSSRT